MRFVHSLQWWSSFRFCHSWTQSIPWLPQYSCFHLAKDHKLAIQPLGLDNARKKLGTVCLEASVCHGQGTRTHMLRDEIFINFLPIDELTTSAIMACEGPTLAYNYKNYSVKAGTFIIKSSLPSAQNMKVFCCLWKFVLQTARRRCSRNVKELRGADHGWAAQEALGWHCLQGLEKWKC